MATTQEVFNKVALHLLTQYKPAKTLGFCRYRSADGLSCAVGCLIPDNLYDSNMEGGSVLEVLRVAKENNLAEEFACAGISTQNLPLLQGLQLIHDCKEPRNWYNSLCDIAKEYYLTMPCNEYGVPLWLSR